LFILEIVSLIFFYFSETMSSINDCTHCITGDTKLVQYYRLCLTCSAVGVCLNCSAICHDGHKLGTLLRDKFYCQCQQITHQCRAISNNNVVESSSVITQPVAANKKRKYTKSESEKNNANGGKFYVWTKPNGGGKTFVASFISQEEANKEVKKIFVQENPWELSDSDLMFQDSFTLSEDDGFVNMKVDYNNESWEAGCEFMEGKVEKQNTSEPKEKKAKHSITSTNVGETATISKSKQAPPLKPSPPLKQENEEDDDDEMVIFADVKPKYEVEDSDSPEKAAEAPQKKKTRPKKQPGEPKGPVASFMVFSNLNREKITAENPGLQMTDISKAIGQKWKALSAEEKLPYEESAKNDRLR
jgi:hypothetical protein